MSRPTETKPVASRRQSDDAATDAWIERTLADAPPLTDRQRTALAELLRPVRIISGGQS